MSLKMRPTVVAKRPAPFTRRAIVGVTCRAQRSPSTTSAAFSAPAATTAAASLLGCLAAQLLGAQLALAEFRLPPIDNDPHRCERGYVGNTIGQANAVSDKLLDLRQCSYRGADLHGRVLAGALLAEADMQGANLQEAVLTKAYAVNVNMAGADLTNAVVDRVDFSGANLRGVRFINTVVTGAQFEGADLAESVWEDALIGSQDVGKLCDNPTLTGESRAQVGCRVRK
ncbi:hypothetical protein Agub_g15601 [Astrephomene gubernaculifera]|uniref:Uncharacterized protein n=1 Tax=Astrephomene gubernaculifera TaxID=47775 RepID=A0AAD3HT77_9CHLO|nr:hypothetical protein Agub_g15601 [Astrephomene gubernaculifera]